MIKSIDTIKTYSAKRKPLVRVKPLVRYNLRFISGKTKQFVDSFKSKFSCLNFLFFCDCNIFIKRRIRSYFFNVALLIFIPSIVDFNFISNRQILFENKVGFKVVEQSFFNNIVGFSFIDKFFFIGNSSFSSLISLINAFMKLAEASMSFCF